MANPATLSQPFSFYRGDSFRKSITLAVKDSNGNIVGTDLTAYGSDWHAQLRSMPDSGTKVDFELDLSGLTSGTIVFILDADKTAELPNKGVWDLQAVDITQDPAFVQTVLRGTFILVKDVTRV